MSDREHATGVHPDADAGEDALLPGASTSDDHARREQLFARALVETTSLQSSTSSSCSRSSPTAVSRSSTSPRQG
jgi:hypothetical protein